jgi:hypothetical protein
MIPKITVREVGNNVITALMLGAPNAIGVTADAFVSGAAVADGQAYITGLTAGCPVAGTQVRYLYKLLKEQYLQITLVEHFHY